MKEQYQQEWKFHLDGFEVKHGDKASGRKEVPCMVRREKQQILKV